jgi:hypothetical protein
LWIKKRVGELEAVENKGAETRMSTEAEKQILILLFYTRRARDVKIEKSQLDKSAG